MSRGADDDKPVVGLNGEPISTPQGVWYAAVGEDGQLARDDAGRLIRVRPPSSRPRIPLKELVAGTLAT